MPKKSSGSGPSENPITFRDPGTACGHWMSPSSDTHDQDGARSGNRLVSPLLRANHSSSCGISSFQSPARYSSGATPSCFDVLSAIPAIAMNLSEGKDNKHSVYFETM